MKASSANANEFIDAVNSLAQERRIDKEMLFAAIESALVSAYKRNYATTANNVRVSIDRDRGEFEVYARKTVVSDVTDPQTEISLDAARQISPQYEEGDLTEERITPNQFGRIAAQTAKQVVVQRIREAERGVIYDEFIEKENEILTALVQRMEGGRILVELGRTEGVIEPNHQMPGEMLSPNDRVKVYVLEVNKTTKGPQVTVSRTHSGLIKRLFELEVPEIQSGIVQIKSIAREAGSRTKMAVYSTDPSIDSVGACVGPRGTRVENVVGELKIEKIDIVKWSSDPAEYITNALNPARALSVFVSEKDKAARVIVPDNQLSLAIGGGGMNARLAAKLTGWKIDIKSQSQAEEMMGALADYEDSDEEALDEETLDQGSDQYNGADNANQAN